MAPPFDASTRTRRAPSRRPQIGRHHRPHIGIDHRRRRALVLARQRQHRRRQRQRQPERRQRRRRRRARAPVRVRVQQAHGDRAHAIGTAAPTRATSSASPPPTARCSTLPSAARRSSTPKRNGASTSGGGSTGCNAYSFGRAWRPISSTSSNPAVVTSATGPPRSLEQRIGRHRRRVRELVDASPRDVPRARQHRLPRRRRFDGSLCARTTPAVVDGDHVGERAAGIDADAHRYALRCRCFCAARSSFV